MNEICEAKMIQYRSLIPTIQNNCVQVFKSLPVYFWAQASGGFPFQSCSPHIYKSFYEATLVLLSSLFSPFPSPIL